TKAASQEWAQEKDELKRELHQQRTSATQLEATVAALKIEGESKRREFESRLKEAAIEAERSLLRAHSDWQSEVAQCLQTGGMQLSAAFERVLPPLKK